MTLTKIVFQQPIFKSQVLFDFKEDEIIIRDANQAFSIASPPEYYQAIAKLLRLLQIGGLSPKQLSEACPDIQEEIPELLANFDNRSLLIETQKKVPAAGMSGSQFYRELWRFVERLKLQFTSSPFFGKMADGTITKNQLIGYALESYHVTHLCPKLLAPALANYESNSVDKLLQEFFASELHHDRLIAKSLRSVGISDEEIQKMQPLPSTFAICSSLAMFAKQHPLSFKTALMLFEQDEPLFHEYFKKQSQALELPRDFYQPILLHAGINEDGGHEDITGVLLAEISYITPSEQLTVKKNMANLMELIVLRSYEIVDYYGNQNNIIPRCFV
ncbi:pyrroloquinoline quinone (coenzyme PQQ) biosynthesis protein C [Rivularia sp. PCC 7116]|uniref:iron-containing redox enzyme family protein n=1 Tax=Rivularia sp. PCC 7116 TaxID=373994 RepID=UPI00029EF7B6|nr:iron-containing redox enzyme family protein [Rivularia sp. PCC 7116]AFY52801.1 pyrroloquinoline quinone (coenzyme PQQ) biosynthesis protein C [Rivularia sp. PCC 7116]